MPSPTTTSLPIPKSWDEFEDICADLLKKMWNDPYVVRHGRSGQKQHGVDIYGYPGHLGGHTSGRIAGAQCKETRSLSLATVEGETEKVKAFEPQLTEYLILTTASRDAVLQQAVRLRTFEFRVHILFWEDISLELSGYDDLIKKHFPEWARKTVSRDDILELLHTTDPTDFDYDDNTGVYVYNRDIQLRLIQDRSTWSQPGGRDWDYFEEGWVKRFPDPHAYRHVVFIEYGGVRLETFHTALVDGGRYVIPYPESQDNLIISRRQYRIGQILNLSKQGGGYRFDDGLRLAGIAIEG